MSLLDISTELITEIAKVLHPSSIVNFALTCHRICECTSASLTLHRTRQRELRAQHDRHPMNIVKLLSMAYTSPELLWYIRVFEFYGARSSWGTWKTYRDYERVADEPEVDLSSSGIQLISDLNLEILFQNFGLDQFVQDSIKRVKNGDDEPLKTLLLACCPNLEKVTWVAYDVAMEPQPYLMLCGLASAYQNLPRTISAPGIYSLRSISLGACIEHVHPHDNLHPDVADFCRLLLLPNLKSLRINVGGYGDPELEYLETHVPARSSSVEEFTFYVCNFDQDTLVAILERSRCLKIYKDIYVGLWTDISKDLQPSFKDTLEELRPDGENEFETRLYDDISDLLRFSKLRVLNIYVGDLIAEDITDEFFSALHEDEKEIQWHDFHAILPETLEKIQFGWPPSYRFKVDKERNLHTTIFTEFFGQLDKFIQIRRKASGGCLRMISLNLCHMRWVEEQYGAIEAREYEDTVSRWSELWGEAGVEVVQMQKSEKDEILECRPSAPVYDD